MTKREVDKSHRKEATKSGLANIPALDHAKKNVLMMAIGFVPYIGTSLSIFVDKYVPEKKEKRIITFIEELGDVLSESQEDIDVNQIHSDEFLYIFERTFRAVADTHHQVKRECYKAILLNTLQKPHETSFEQKELYVKLVDELTALHIVVLRALYENQSKGVVNNYEQVVERLKNYPSDQVFFLIRDLENKGLLKTSESWAKFAGNLPGWDDPSPDHGLPHQVGLTAMCRNFLSFISH